MLIEDESLSLRRLRVEDLQAFQSYRCDPQVGAYQTWKPMDDGEARRFLENASTAPLFAPGAWSQIAVEADGLVGDAGLLYDPDAEEVEVGLTLARGAQGLGYGQRAARLIVQLIWRDTPARRIRAICDARNTAALRLMARTAFVEGPPRTTDGIAERQFTLDRPNLP